MNGGFLMKAKHASFGTIEVDGKKYEHDLIIDGGTIKKRSKKPSKQYKSRFGHTPLSVNEDIPWNGKLVIGTGASGRLPVMDEVYDEAEERGTEIVEVQTDKACQLISDMPESDVKAILHSTC
jgi:hypothetical protein